MTPALHDAVLRTLAYADVFDFPLTPAELHRSLIGVPATPPAVEAAVEALAHRVVERRGLVTLAGREGLIEPGRERRRLAARTWPVAVRYAQAVGSLPFVRMVAITGSLAVGDATLDADIDLLVVTERGRVWLGRASALLLVRHAAQRGLELCPNYVLGEHRLAMEPRDLYGAHELVQMVPIVGHDVYRRLRASNAWTSLHLPNADGPPDAARAARPPALRRLQPLSEAVLRTPVGDAIERWEQRRKIPRLEAQAAGRGASEEAGFSADWCKGHLDGHGSRIRAAYEARTQALGLEPVW